MLIKRTTILLLNNLKNGTKLKTGKLISKFKNDYLISCTLFSRSLCESVNGNDLKKNEIKPNDKSTNKLNEKSTIKLLSNQASSNDKSTDKLLYAGPVLKGALSVLRFDF